jgi:hypothetical protein
MSWNDPQLLRWQVTLHDVEIRATHATGAHSQQHVTGPDARIGHVGYVEWTLQNRLRRIENGSLHAELTDAAMMRYASEL